MMCRDRPIFGTEGWDSLTFKGGRERVRKQFEKRGKFVERNWNIKFQVKIFNKRYAHTVILRLIILFY